jgi:hypothetical protein
MKGKKKKTLARENNYEDLIEEFNVTAHKLIT